MFNEQNTQTFINQFPKQAGHLLSFFFVKTRGWFIEKEHSWV